MFPLGFFSAFGLPGGAESLWIILFAVALGFVFFLRGKDRGRFTGSIRLWVFLVTSIVICKGVAPADGDSGRPAQTQRGIYLPTDNDKKKGDPELEKMKELGRRAGSGDITAIDALAEAHEVLYQDINYQTERDRVMANLRLMRAAFDILGDKAGGDASAFKALRYANGKSELRDFASDAFGRAAAMGNEQALEALLNYKMNGWLLSSVVFALKYPAEKNNPKAVDFLIEVLRNPQSKALWSGASQELVTASYLGNDKAKMALEEFSKK